MHVVLQTTGGCTGRSALRSPARVAVRGGGWRGSGLPRWVVVVLTGVLLTVRSQAALGVDPEGTALISSLSKLFGTTTAFSAQMETRITDGGNKESMSLQVDLALLDGKVRTDMDMARMKSAELSPPAVAQMRKMGMDRMHVIMRPDRKAMWILYPGLKAYVDAPVSDLQKKAMQASPRLEKVEIGRETVDGHPCIKSKVTIVEDAGRKQEVLVWSATDLKDFPLRMQFADEGNTVTLTFRNLQTKAPEPAHFDPPAGFRRYEGFDELMRAAAASLISSGLK